ncbi:MAG: hypothetical protein ABSA58_15735 [Acetobacteraceae bacterium]|jgi:hypothetical protein
MPDEFEEKLRKAAGIQTMADRKAEVEARAYQAAEWDRNAPMRERALQYYNTAVVPLINATMLSALKVAKEFSPPHVISIEPQLTPLEGFLAQRTFHLQPPPARTVHQGGFSFTVPLIVATLRFDLRPDQSLAIGIQERDHVPGTSPGILVDHVTLSDIQDGFLMLLAQLKR